MGLLNEQPKQQPDQENQQVAQPQNKDEETYKKLGLAAMKIIYSKPESDNVLAILGDGKDMPENAVAQASLAVIRRLQNDMKGAVDKNLAFSVAPVLIMLIFELGFKAEIFTEKSFKEGVEPQEVIGEVLSILAQLTEEQPQGAPQQAPQGQAIPQGMPPQAPQQPMGV